jgi:glycosyltransferase involved in cell wall biosynthesis/tetratricopeptide (TPR) repeat protein
MPTLSVCLIVKNEARHLDRCLASVRGLADEIVVVDTGSTDSTVDIARAHGARVHHFAWQDDFSLAKNFSIEQATGDWILSLDGDESIAQRDHEAIRRFTRRDDVDAVLAAQRHYLPADTVTVGWQAGSGGYDEGTPYAGFLDVDCRRLFRNRPALRFRNRVHEELVSLDPAQPLREVRGAWVIHHFGKLGDHALLRAKGEAYLRIGKKKVDDQPADPQAHYELGIQYSELDEPALAIAHHRRALELSPGFRDASLRIAFCHGKLAQHREALAALDISARTLPDRALEIASAQGNAYRQLGDDQNAERAFKRALKISPGFPPASVNLALLHRRQNRLPEALACVDRALRAFPQHVQARRLRAELRLASGDDAGALTDLEPLRDDAAARRLMVRILMQQRRFHDARARLEGVQDDIDGELMALRGAVALGLGELDEAVALLQRSLQIGANYEAALNLSLAQQARQDHPAALEAAAEALRLNPTATEALDRFAQLSGPAVRARSAACDARRLTLFFYLPHRAFDGNTPRTQGLGGTESAVVYLAEALVARGHRCVVFNGCESPVEVHGVQYARWESLPVRSVSDRPDVVVGVRFWETLGRARFAPLQILWTGDAFDQPFLSGLADPDRRREIDLFMLQSTWQIETFRAHHGLPSSRIVRTTLGTAASSTLEAEAPPAAMSRPRRLAYASTPFRGLDVLLDLFPRIRAACPDAELEVFSSMRVYGVSESADQAQYSGIYDKARQPGVTLVGSLPQLELASRLQQARVLAYPNHYAETFCIAAAEAQAAGCAVVTSQLGALPETVGPGGVCIPGNPQHAVYRDAFVAACVELLRDDQRWQAMSDRARANAAANYSWPSIAAHWETLCGAALRTETPEMDRISVHLTAGRAGLAQRMLERTAQPADVPDEAWLALRTFTAWRAGAGITPSIDTLQSLSLHFPSLRRSGAVDDALAIATRSEARSP